MLWPSVCMLFSACGCYFVLSCQNSFFSSLWREFWVPLTLACICSITYPFVLSESLKPKFWVDIFPRRDVLGWLTKPSCRRWFHFLLVFFMRSCCGDRCAGIESARNGHRPYFVSRGHRGLPPLLQWLHQWSSGKDHIPLYSMWRQFRLVVLQ